MEKVRLAIVGCGGIANGKHLPSLSKLQDVEIIAFCDLIEERAQKAAAQYGVPGARIYTDYRKLLENEPEADAVSVLTPNRAHSEISVAALDAGKHVMSEKPMAINYAEGKRMLDAAKRNGKLLTVGYQHRQDPDIRYAKAEAEAGVFGDIYFTKARVLRRRGVPTWGIFQNQYEQGGGPLIDVGTHALDAVLYIMDNYEPKYVCGSVYHKLNDLPYELQGNPFGHWDKEKFEVEDSAFGYIVMKNGATILLESSWALNTLEGSAVQYQICGTRAGCDNFSGKLRINGVKHDVQYIVEPNFASSGVSFFEGNQHSPTVAEQRIYINAVKGKGDLCVRPGQALTVVKILDAIYESARAGKPVYFD